MKSLFELTWEVAQELRKGGIWTGAATADPGAGATSLTDTTLGLIAGTVDGGTIWFPNTTPPETRIISTQTATVINWTGAINLSANEEYYIFGKTWPRWALRDAVNRALKNVGMFARYDTMDSVGLQEDYDLSADPTNAPLPNRVMSVEQSSYTDPSTAVNAAWTDHISWIQFSETLRFLDDPPPLDGVANLRLGYNVDHPVMSADSDEIEPEVSPKRLMWEAVAEAYMHLIGPHDSQALDEQSENLFNRAITRAGGFPTHRNEPLPEPSIIIDEGAGGLVDPDLVV